MRVRHIAELAAAFAITISLARAAGPNPVPTFDQLQALHDSGQYRSCLQQIARAIRLANNPANGYDLYALQLLRADCLLHEGDRSSALAAYRIVMKSPNTAQAAEARALTKLVTQSAQMIYTPRNTSLAQAINITDDKNRKQALMLLYDDELRNDKPEIDRAIAAKDLVPILKAVPMLEELYALETASSGTDTKTRPLMRAVGDQARTLMARELTVLNDRITSIGQKANQIQDFSGPALINNGVAVYTGNGNRRGLFSTDRQNLRDMIDYIDRIGDTAQRGQSLARSYDGDVAGWGQIIDQAARAKGNAQNVLEAE